MSFLKNKKVIAAVLVLVVLALFWIWKESKETNRSGYSEYSAVYLTTGDIYFGKMDWFPMPHLKNVWYLQRGVNAQNQTQLGVARFKDVFYGPVDEVYLNPKTVVWWTLLRKDSNLLQGINNVQK